MCSVTLAMMAASTIMQGMQAKAQGKYEQGVQEYNARVSENEATATRNAGIEAENDQRMKTAGLLAKQRAAMAARGADVESGSALEIQEDTSLLGNVDAMRIRQNYEGQASALDQSAVLSRAQGAAAKTRGSNAFTGSLISAAGSVAGKWYGAGGGGSDFMSIGAPVRNSLPSYVPGR